MSNNNNSTSGLGVCSVLTIIFVVLKLVGVIDWSWWLVFLPTLISVGFGILAIIIYIIYLIYDDKKYGLTPKKGKRDKWKF